MSCCALNGFSCEYNTEFHHLRAVMFSPWKFSAAWWRTSYLIYWKTESELWLILSDTGVGRATLSILWQIFFSQCRMSSLLKAHWVMLLLSFSGCYLYSQHSAAQSCPGCRSTVFIYFVCGLSFENWMVAYGVYWLNVTVQLLECCLPLLDFSTPKTEAIWVSLDNADAEMNDRTESRIAIWVNKFRWCRLN
jgi:hypothetical protein